MRPGGPTASSAAPTAVSEDKTRKTLHTLQPAATDKENLVGAGRTLRSSGPIKPIVNDEMSATTQKIEAPKKDNKKTKKSTLKGKSSQTVQGSQGKIKIEIEDLTSEAGPSENYWKVLAERRGVALYDALEENKELHETVERLKEENRIQKEMLDETRALVEVLQEMIGEDHNDINNSLDDSRL